MLRLTKREKQALRRRVQLADDHWGFPNAKKLYNFTLEEVERAITTIQTKMRKRDGDKEQIDAAYQMYWDARAWREANPERCKNPDAKGEKLL